MVITLAESVLSIYISHVDIQQELSVAMCSFIASDYYRVLFYIGSFTCMYMFVRFFLN